MEEVTSWVRSYRGADVASDHHLVVAQLILRLAANKLSGQRVTRKKSDIDKFNHGEKKNKFQEEFKKSLDQERVNDLTLLWTSDINQGSYARQKRKHIRAKPKYSVEGLDHGRDVERNKTRKTTKQKINSKR